MAATTCASWNKQGSEREKSSSARKRDRGWGESTKVRVGKKRAGDRVARGRILNINLVGTSINVVY